MATEFQEQPGGQAQHTGAFQASAWVVFANVPLGKAGQVTAPEARGETRSTSLWEE